MNARIRQAAAIALAIALTQVVGCGTARKSGPQASPNQFVAQGKLQPWKGFEDCATDFVPYQSQLPSGGATPPAFLVDTGSAGWNCAAISEGHYDAEVVVHWSNGFDENVLELKNIEIAPGRRLIAKAYERGVGELPARFFRVKSQPDATLAAAESAAPSSTPAPNAPPAAEEKSEAPVAAPEPQGTQAPVNPPRDDKAPDSAPAEAPSSAHPAVIALGIAAAPLALTYFAAMGTMAVLATPFMLIDRKRIRPAREAPRSPEVPRSAEALRPGPSADCCFVWVEDAATGEIVAGRHPSR